MADDQSFREFMREGVSKYPVARATVKLFQERLLQLIRIAISSQVKRFGLTVKGVPSWWDGEDINGVAGAARTTLDAGSGREASIEVGLWWNPPDVELAEPRVIAYASIYDKPVELFHFEAKPTDALVRWFTYESSGKVYTILYVPTGLNDELAEPLALVVRSLSAHIDQHWKP